MSIGFTIGYITGIAAMLIAAAVFRFTRQYYAALHQGNDTLKVYYLEYWENDPAAPGGGGMRREWFPSVSASGARKRELRESPGIVDLETKGVDVPTDKTGLLAFLNAWLGYDSGRG